MVKVQAVFDGATHSVSEPDISGGERPAAMLDAAASAGRRTDGDEPARSLLSPPAPPTQRRSLFRR